MIALVSCLRNIPVALTGDEITYFNIAQELANNGRFYHEGLPSMVSPVMPFIILVGTFFQPDESIIWIPKLIGFSFSLIGLNFLWRFLKAMAISDTNATCIVALTICNPVFIRFSASLYPDAIAFGLFWILIYMMTRIKKMKHLFIILLVAAMLVLTRYVFAVLLIPIVFVFYQNRQHLLKFAANKSNFIVYSVLITLTTIPLFLWTEYILSFTGERSTTISYFSRYEQDGLFGQIKTGLGFIKGEEVARVNGIPAFATVFLPITGFRSWFVSLAILIPIVIGWVLTWKQLLSKIIIISAFIILSGYVLAGTGFSRYWLGLIPIFIFGIFSFAKKMKFSDNKLYIATLIICSIYILNEIRLDILVIQRDW